MGATFVLKKFDGNMRKKDLSEAYRKYRNQLMVEHGTDAYNGTFTTLEGFEISDKYFDNPADAEEWLMDNCDKWRNAIAVKAAERVPVPAAKTTFAGEEPHDWERFLTYPSPAKEDEMQRGKFGLATFNLARVVSEKGKQVAVPADVLPGEAKAEVVDVLEYYLSVSDTIAVVDKNFTSMVGSAKASRRLLTDEEWEKLKNWQETWVTMQKELPELGRKLDELMEKYEDVVWPKVVEDRGVRWLVGGWCST